MELTQISFSRHNSATSKIQTIRRTVWPSRLLPMDSCETSRYSLFRSQRIDYNSLVGVLHPQLCISTEASGRTFTQSKL